jgi:hypothetical protein
VGQLATTGPLFVDVDGVVQQGRGIRSGMPRRSLWSVMPGRCPGPGEGAAVQLPSRPRRAERLGAGSLQVWTVGT